MIRVDVTNKVGHDVFLNLFVNVVTFIFIEIDSTFVESTSIIVTF